MKSGKNGDGNGQETDRLLYSRRGAAVLLGVCDRTLDRAVGEKRIRVVRIGRRVLFPRSELDRIAQAGLPTNG